LPQGRGRRVDSSSIGSNARVFLLSDVLPGRLSIHPGGDPGQGRAAWRRWSTWAARACRFSSARQVRSGWPPGRGSMGP